MKFTRVPVDKMVSDGTYQLEVLQGVTFRLTFFSQIIVCTCLGIIDI